jgi:hypothetical protein
MTNVAFLIENQEKIPPKDYPFVQSLLKQAAKKSLSEKQMYWVDTIAERIRNADKPAEKVRIPVGDLSGILALFSTAKKVLKTPKIVIGIDKIEYALWIAKDHHKVPGSINVGQKGGEWLGRILPTGEFVPSSKVKTLPEGLVAGLSRFAAEPAKVASEYGQNTKRCCFCRLRLTDPRSKDVGYGYVCSTKFGLPWGEMERVAA